MKFGSVDVPVYPEIWVEDMLVALKKIDDEVKKGKKAEKLRYLKYVFKNKPLLRNAFIKFLSPIKVDSEFESLFHKLYDHSNVVGGSFMRLEKDSDYLNHTDNAHIMTFLQSLSYEEYKLVLNYYTGKPLKLKGVTRGTIIDALSEWIDFEKEGK